MHRPATVVLTLVATAALALGACDDGTGGGGGGPGGSPGQTADIKTGVVLTEETALEPFVIAEGRYRISWRHTCEEIGVLLLHANGTEEFSETSERKTFSVIRFNVPGGQYELSQTNPACTDFEIRVDKM